MQILTLPEYINYDFETIWNLHPNHNHIIKMFGKDIPVSRYQQAYEKSYSYSGTVNHNLPLPDELTPFLDYVKNNIDIRLNGILVNWYDFSENHHIGAHQDSIVDLEPGTPIVTISLGSEMIFKLSGAINEKIQVKDRVVLVMPWDVNLSCKHQILKPQLKLGKRISLTFRVFK
jgi:alkylated DNA repair dioxygenase AlkB